MTTAQQPVGYDISYCQIDPALDCEIPVSRRRVYTVCAKRDRVRRVCSETQRRKGKSAVDAGLVSFLPDDRW